MMRREARRGRLAEKFSAKRDSLRKIINDPNKSVDDKIDAQRQMQSLPRDSNKARSTKRCSITGRANGYYNLVGICRNMFRIHAMEGDIPGVKKASW